MGVRDSIRNAWKRLGGEELAAKSEVQQRKTVPLPSILAPYNAQRALPKPTPANLRKFAETPLVRRAINIIKDRVASMDWQVRLKRDYTPDKVGYASKKLAILRRTLEEPNDSDSFRTLIEQVIEDALVGGFGAIEMDLTGVPEKPFELWPVDGEFLSGVVSAVRHAGRAGRAPSLLLSAITGDDRCRGSSDRTGCAHRAHCIECELPRASGDGRERCAAGGMLPQFSAERDDVGIGKRRTGEGNDRQP